MNRNVFIKKYPVPAPDIDEIRRYMGDRGKSEAVEKVILECLDESRECFDCRVCWGIYPLTVTESSVDFGFTRAESTHLAKNLESADKAVIFAATSGLGIDRLIKEYAALSPLKSLCFDAIGTDAIENLCNIFNAEIGESFGLCRPRFSPGYGDLDISFQKKIFEELPVSSGIGVFLSDSLQMTPSKSVTAIIGVKDEIS